MVCGVYHEFQILRLLHQSSPISQNKHKSPPNQPSQPPPNPFPSDEARYGWTHGIAERKSDLVDTTVLKRGLRVSLTLRRVRTQPCTCQWKALCDSWLADPSSALLPAGQQLEDAHVHEVYATTFPAIFFRNEQSVMTPSRRISVLLATRRGPKCANLSKICRRGL
jgi:hypothetical protein